MMQCARCAGGTLTAPAFLLRQFPQPGSWCCPQPARTPGLRHLTIPPDASCSAVGASWDHDAKHRPVLPLCPKCRCSSPPPAPCFVCESCICCSWPRFIIATPLSKLQ